MLKELGVLMFYGIESSFALAFLGLALLGIRLHWKKIITIGFLHGIIVQIIRFLYTALGIKLGSHIILTFISMVLMIKYVARVQWGVATAATFIGSIALIISEMLLGPVYLKITHSTADEMFRGLWSHVAMGYFTNSLFFLLALVVGVTGFSLFKTERHNLGE